MATEDLLSLSVASMVEDVLEQHGKRLNDIDLASRKAEEAGIIFLFLNLLPFPLSAFKFLLFFSDFFPLISMFLDFHFLPILILAFIFCGLKEDCFIVLNVYYAIKIGGRSHSTESITIAKKTTF